MRRRALVFVGALVLPDVTRAAVPEDTLESTSEAPRALVGAASPAAGDFVVRAAAGVVFVLPYASLGARLGLGRGTRIGAHYQNLAGLGQGAGLHGAWGGFVGRNLVLGVTLRSSYMTLELADLGLFGIAFSSLPLANDWEAGADLTLTWLRGDDAALSFELGSTTSLGGTRYTAFEEREFQIEPSFRSIDFGIQGEWPLAATRHLFLRLDGMILTGTEIRPLGFLPTGSAGLAWAL